MVVPFDKLEFDAYYVRPQVNINSLKENGKIIFSRLQCGADAAPYNVFDFRTITEYVLKYGREQTPVTREQVEYVVKLITGKIKLGFTRVSAGHLRYLTFRELANMKCKDMGLVYRIVGPLLHSLRNSDNHEAMAVSIVLWAMSLKKEYKLLAQGILALKPCKNVSEFMDNAKSMSVRAKAMQGICGTNLAPFFEMQVLANRGVGNLSWRDEEEHRVRPRLANIDHRDIYKWSKKLFLKGRRQGAKPRRSRWEDFFLSRWSWAPTGSYHSQHSEDMENLPKDRELRNKFYMLSATSFKQISHYVSRKPEIHAWASTKWEWGKMRAIYGVDLTSFINMAYGFLGCEDVLPQEFPVGPKSGVNYVRDRLKLIMPNRVAYCLDYEDFNSQHSIDAMKAVMLAYLDVWGSWLDKDQVTAIKWSIKATDEQWIHDPEGRFYRVAGTMLSGWRLTSFMNSVLNWVYTYMCCDGVVETEGLHNGDDVLLPVDNYAQVKRIEENLRSRNLRSQPPKCNLAGVAEFLRVDHSSGDGTQYLARSISTVVHGRTESIIPSSLHGCLSALHDRVSEIRARISDKDIVDEIQRVSLGRLNDIWAGRCDVDLESVMATHKLAGGVSDTVTPKANRLDIWYEQYIVGSRDTKGEYSKILPGCYDYARQLANQLFTEKELPRIARQVQQSVLAALSIKVVSIRQVANKYGKSQHWLSHFYRSLKGTQYHGKVMLAKAYGFPPISALDLKASEIITRLKRYDDISLWSKILC